MKAIIFKNQKLEQCKSNGIIDALKHFISIWNTYEKLGIVKHKK